VKKLMISALAALCAMLALPAFASALPAHLDKTPEAISISGGASALTRVGGGETTGTSVTGSGSFENTTTGKITLTFHGVKAHPGPFKCNSTGEPAETVMTTELPFHLIMLETNVPGILITPNTTVVDGKPVEGTKHFATLHCGIFVGTIVVKGTGIIGTITSPKCNESSTTATASFTSNGAGVQNHKNYTGKDYYLESSLGGGAFVQSAMQAHATINLGVSSKLICTH
jgi:hypothetical protein